MTLTTATKGNMEHPAARTVKLLRDGSAKSLTSARTDHGPNSTNARENSLVARTEFELDGS